MQRTRRKCTNSDVPPVRRRCRAARACTGAPVPAHRETEIEPETETETETETQTQTETDTACVYRRWYVCALHTPRGWHFET